MEQTQKDDIQAHLNQMVTGQDFIATELACEMASIYRPSYYTEDFKPHQWVVEAIKEAVKNAMYYRTGGVLTENFRTQMQDALDNDKGEEVTASIALNYISQMEAIAKLAEADPACK